MSGECDICGEHCLHCECHNFKKGKGCVSIKNKKKIIKDLMSTFEDRSALHEAYKEKMKDIILISVSYVLVKVEEYIFAHGKVPCEIEIYKFISEFVESHFEMEKE